MSSIDYRYDVEEVADHQILTYLFVSKGQSEDEDVLKVIQYAYVQHFDQKPVFNLGFGDFDLGIGGISDDSLTGNGIRNTQHLSFWCKAVMAERHMRQPAGKVVRVIVVKIVTNLIVE